MIIDSLTHVTPDGKWFHTNHDASVSRLLREMDKAHVEKAVVVALAGFISNEFVLKTCRDYPDRLVPGASINPSAFASPRHAGQAARDILMDQEFAVLKLHPRLNGYDPLDYRSLAVLEGVAALDRPVPIWLDTLFRSPRCALRKPPLDAIHDLLRRFPGLTFVLLHAGGAQLLQLAELVGGFPNLILDISLTLLYYAGTSLDADLAWVTAHRDARTIVGSDFPEHTQTDYLGRLALLMDGQSLSVTHKFHNLVGGNLARVLGLSA
jgi:predicted TIM-barrel fold metal-dependent hydrolase